MFPLFTRGVLHPLLIATVMVEVPVKVTPSINVEASRIKVEFPRIAVSMVWFT